MKKLIIVIAFLALALLVQRVYVQATFNPPTGKVNICHCERPIHGAAFQCQTLNLPIVAANIHLNIHPHDYSGSCQQPSNTPTVTPSPTDTITPSPTVSLDPTPTATPSGTLTPSPTVTTPPEPSQPSQNDPGHEERHDTVLTDHSVAPHCESAPTTKTGANFHIYRNGDTAIAKWTATEGSHANIYYKENSSSSWQHAVRDILNSGYFEIHGLGSGDFTFALQQSNNCAGGPLTDAIIDGPGDGHWTLFR